MQTKNRLIALALMIVLTAPMIMMIGQASAAAAPVNLPTFLYVNASPSPVGVGQTVYITLFVTKPVPTLTGGYSLGQDYLNMKINIIKPDGTNITLGPYESDTTGGVPAVTFVPTVEGNYTFQGIYPGQVLGTDPNNGLVYNLDPAMSPAVTVAVQANPVSYWYSTSSSNGLLDNTDIRVKLWMGAISRRKLVWLRKTRIRQYRWIRRLRKQLPTLQHRTNNSSHIVDSTNHDWRSTWRRNRSQRNHLILQRTLHSTTLLSQSSSTAYFTTAGTQPKLTTQASSQSTCSLDKQCG